MTDSATLYGLMVEFDSPEALKDAARRVCDEGFKEVEAFTPMPVEGLDDILGHDDKWIAALVLGGALFGATLAFGMQTYSWVWDYPINIGGRPMFSWPSFIPITFELGVLCAALAGFLGMLLLNRLPKLHHPTFEVPGFDRVTSDRFFLMVSADDERFDRHRTAEFLDSLGGLAVSEVPS